MAATKTSKKHFPRIDPNDFTAGQWEEAYNVDRDEVLPCEQHHRALQLPAERETVKRILALAGYCRDKAANLSGQEDHPGQDAAWREDLISAAEVLERTAGVESPARPTAIYLDSNELATVLAALRMFQQRYEDADGNAIAQDWPDHFTDDKGGRIEPLGTDDINTLCERINT